MSRRLKAALAVSLAATLIGNIAWRLLSTPGPLGEDKHLAYVFPGADGFSGKEGSPPRYLAYREGPSGDGRTLLGAAFLTSDILPEERGYAGPIHILVGLKTDGTISGARVVSHSETESYVPFLERPEFWQAFSGKPVSDPFTVGEDVDTVTRATITLEAISRSLRDGGRIVAREALALDVPPPAGEKPGVPRVRVVLVALAALGALLSFYFRGDVIRTAVLVFSAVSLGFYGGLYISLGQLANLAAGRYPPLAAHLDWYLLLGVSVLFALILGNLFCGWLCPFGALQELLARGARFLGIKAYPGRREAEVLRYFYLWITLMAAFALGRMEAVNYEPCGIVFDWRGKLLHWLFAGTVLVGSVFILRFWCRFFCPVGVVMQILSSVKTRKKKFSLQRDVIRMGSNPEGEDSPTGPTTC